MCRYVAGRRRSGRRPFIAFDEWNVWYRTRNRSGTWADGAFPAHLVEEVYDLQDALVCAQFLLSFIRNAHVVKIANIAQIVNVIAPVLTDGDNLLRQSIFEALSMFVGRRHGISLHVGYDGGQVPSPDFGAVAMVDGAAILDVNHELHVYAVNRSVDETVELEINLAGADLEMLSMDVLHHSDPATQNTWEAPNAVKRVPGEMSNGPRPVMKLPPHSFTAATMSVS